MLNVADLLLFTTSPNDQHGLNPVRQAITESFLFSPKVGTHLDELPDNRANDCSPASLPCKKVKLLDGETLLLRPRNLQKAIETFEGLAGSIINMDCLFAEANLRDKIKQSNISLGKEAPCRKLAALIKKAAKMWTDKYQPKSILDMCPAGNDRQIRLILYWLKKWSNLVFGANANLTLMEGVDLLGRPLRKILLIHGPPGMGKTALVHVLAKMYGYTLQELNAGNSMDNLPQAVSTAANPNPASRSLKLRISNAMSVNSLQGKPYCLLVDELDLSMNSGEIIKVLLDMVYADKRSTSQTHATGSADDKTGKKKPKKAFVLNRPIICIVNDLYAPPGSNTGYGSPIDKLRAVSDIVPLRKPRLSTDDGNAVKTIKTFLEVVSKREKLELSSAQISEIAASCDYDIRACINQLQLYRKAPQTDFCGIELVKDTSMAWYTIVDILFKRDLQMSKQDNFIALIDSLINGSGRATLCNSPVMSKIMRGCFNRYLDSVHYSDNSLAKPSEMSDWFLFYDQLGDAYEGAYGGFTCLKIWTLFSEINPRLRDLPLLIPDGGSTAALDAIDSRRHNSSLARKFLNSLTPALMTSLGESPDTVASVTIPLLSQMFNTNLSSKLWLGLDDTERRSVEKLVSLMKALDIDLETERDLETGKCMLQYNPNWDSLVTFNTDLATLKLDAAHARFQSRRAVLFPVLEQVLSRSSSIVTLKRAIPGNEANENTDSNAKKMKMGKVGNTIDFFKLQYDSVSTQSSLSSTGNRPANQATRIWIKYHEGYSNAVRKNIGWQDLWKR